ncbi:signal peptidase I [Streptomyces sp. NPDC090054]|uniref:signal peptidase I n=1 Tax=Streptomyces sp. NPDC090054 TaxID=3365933 RepID=UPI0038008B47
MARENRRPGRGLGMAAAVLAVVGAALVAGAAFSVVRPVTAASDSMLPTLVTGRRIHFEQGPVGTVARGDIVRVTVPWVREGDVLNRVVAVGGDRVSYTAGATTLTLNGEPLVEPYLREAGRPSAFAFDVTVPAGRIFVMGDHRLNSRDSAMDPVGEQQGTVPAANVRAKVTDSSDGFLLVCAVGLLGVLGLTASLGLGFAALLARGDTRRAEFPFPHAASPHRPA